MLGYIHHRTHSIDVWSAIAYIDILNRQFGARAITAQSGGDDGKGFEVWKQTKQSIGNQSSTSSPTSLSLSLPLPIPVGWKGECLSASTPSRKNSSIPPRIHLTDYYSAIEEQEAIIDTIKSIFANPPPPPSPSSSSSSSSIYGQLPEGFVSEHSIRKLNEYYQINHVDGNEKRCIVGVFFKTQ